ncbi:hypothetical protein AcW1_008024 [Taiwanofungus camphoratus]|nr:hypothetical protein AcW1_008024 [Antrodia cinnamomea]KAI0955737.1 hypothetical protein AcV7_006317 [Antrodia cinnamomea]
MSLPDSQLNIGIRDCLGLLGKCLMQILGNYHVRGLCALPEAEYCCSGPRHGYCALGFAPHRPHPQKAFLFNPTACCVTCSVSQ